LEADRGLQKPGDGVDFVPVINVLMGHDRKKLIPNGRTSDLQDPSPPARFNT